MSKLKLILWLKGALAAVILAAYHYMPNVFSGSFNLFQDVSISVNVEEHFDKEPAPKELSPKPVDKPSQ